MRCELETQNDSVDQDAIWPAGGLPGQMGQRICGGTMEHSPIEAEARAVAGTVEGLSALVEANRTAEVRAVDGEHIDLSSVFDHKTTEGKVAGGVVAAAIGHDEGGVGTGRGIKLNYIPVDELIDGLIQRDPQELLPLSFRRCRPQIQRTGASPETTVAVNRAAIHEPRKVRRVTGFLTTDSASKPSYSMAGYGGS